MRRKKMTEHTIELEEIDLIEICHNNITIDGYGKGLFGRRKHIRLNIGKVGFLTSIIDEGCTLRYPAGKFMESNAQKIIKIGDSMN